MNDQVEIFTPELIKLGYETNVLEIIETEDDSFLAQKSDVIDWSSYGKLIKIKDSLRKSYYDEFLRSLTVQATQIGEKYSPKSHSNLQPEDVVLIRDKFVKAIDYPLG